jgi:hypothetical protein
MHPTSTSLSASRDTTHNLTTLNLDRGSGQLLFERYQTGSLSNWCWQGIPLKYIDKFRVVKLWVVSREADSDVLVGCIPSGRYGSQSGLLLKVMNMQLDKSFAYSSDFPIYTFFSFFSKTTHNLTTLNLDRGSGQLLFERYQTGSLSNWCWQGIPLKYIDRQANLE